ncbi:MAG: hypothetical protein ACE5JA_06990 [bacterium]
MNRRVLLLSAVLLFVLPARVFSSWGDFGFRGYIKDMVSLSNPGYGNGWRFDNVVHTRQNVRWYPFHDITGVLELKTRLFCGEGMRKTLEFAEALGGQTDYFDWSWTPVDEENVAIISTIDRVWIDLCSGPVEATVGRQRIAWGTNLVWNPMDMFNPYSPLEFDNEERPGTDGLRVQYYTGPSSKIEAAAAPDEEFERGVAAALVKINRWQYDLHFLAGRRGKGTVIGVAWAGQIRGGGFRGEALYTYPDEDSQIPDPHLVAGVSGDYTFPNSFYVLVETLYNQRGTTGPAGGTHLTKAIAEGQLTPARSSLFGQAAYSLTPLIRGSVSGILNPHDRSWYVGPSIDWSVATDLDLTAMGLLFGGEAGTEFGDIGEIMFLRLKWSL